MHPPFRHHHGALHAVFQLADIAGPSMADNRRGRGFGEAAEIAAEFPVEPTEEIVRQQHGVAAAVAQRRNTDGYRVHAIEQVAAEGAVFIAFLEA